MYAGIAEPTAVRKKLLLSSRTIIDSLKRYEKYKLLREKRLIHVEQLKAAVAEINALNRKIKASLPKAPRPKKLKKDELVHETKEEKPTRLDKVQKLEDDLKRIESKLAELEQ